MNEVDSDGSMRSVAPKGKGKYAGKGKNGKAKQPLVSFTHCYFLHHA